MAAVGIFGGTFNPIHNGHMHLAYSALSELKLEKLIFVPSNYPPHKAPADLCSGSDRVEMCRLAIEGKPEFQISDYELTCGGKSYSVFTAEYFKKIFPDRKLFMIIGSDMLLSFDKWFRYADILNILSLAVVSREENDMDMLEKKAESLRNYGEISIIHTGAYPLSSTQIREKIKNGEKYSCYLPEKVVQYIRLNNLYK